MNAFNGRFSRWEYQNIALGAVAQCASFVNRLAFTGTAPQVELAAVVNPLWQLDPDSVDQVYPHIVELSTGLRTVQEVCNGDRLGNHANTLRYILGMLILRGKLAADPDMQRKIRRHLRPISRLQMVEQGEENQPPDAAMEQQDCVFAQLARVYQETISTFPYRIQVQGKADFLGNKNEANRIRALLLAGIRSAMLWHQLGGRRWALILRRRQVRETAAGIRRQIGNSS